MNCIITGGTEGIGREIVKYLAAFKMKMIIIGARNETKALTIRKEIQSVSKNTNTIIRFVKLDLGSFDSIKFFSEKIIEMNFKIDFLINNAGILGYRGLTSDNVEKNFGVNYLGHWLLVNHLIDKLILSSTRIINTSSFVHKYYQEIPHLNDLRTDCKHIGIQKLYNMSKFCLEVFTVTLQRKFDEIEDCKCVAISLCPGVVRTSIQDKYLCGSKLFEKFYFCISCCLTKSPTQGAHTTLYCCLEETLIKGGFYENCDRSERAINSYNEDLSYDLWEKSENLTNMIFNYPKTVKELYIKKK